MQKIRKVNSFITQMQSNTMNANCYIIDTNKGAIAIDSFLTPRDTKALLDEMQKFHKIYGLINTHWHADHCAGNRFFHKLNIPVLAHKNYLNTLLDEKDITYEMYQKKWKKRFPAPNILFTEKLILKTEPEVHLLYSPGHSNDAICIYLPHEKILFSGDTILGNISNKVAIPFFFHGNNHLLMESLKKLNLLNIDCILPGHNDVISVQNIEIAIEYLFNLDTFTKQLRKQRCSMEEIQTELNIKKCLPNFQTLDFWNPKMHKLNLQRNYFLENLI